MSEPFPTIPPQQRTSGATTPGPDDELDIAEVEPDQLAVEHAASRWDNVTGTDVEVVDAAIHGPRAPEGTS